MNKVASAKHLRAIADAYAAADKLAAAFWNSPDGFETRKMNTDAWMCLDLVQRYCRLANDVEEKVTARQG
jgi:hypothetical protein